jgi:hypothetical protein
MSPGGTSPTLEPVGNTTSAARAGIASNIVNKIANPMNVRGRDAALREYLRASAFALVMTLVMTPPP